MHGLPSPFQCQPSAITNKSDLFLSLVSPLQLWTLFHISFIRSFHHATLFLALGCCHVLHLGILSILETPGKEESCDLQIMNLGLVIQTAPSIVRYMTDGKTHPEPCFFGIPAMFLSLTFLKGIFSSPSVWELGLNCCLFYDWIY